MPTSGTLRLERASTALERGEIDEDAWFDTAASVFAETYLAASDDRAQSGFSGDRAAWTALRRPIAKAIDRPGGVLDIGCANGLLMEDLVRWSPHELEPYGLELAPELAAHARRRLPRWADRIFVGNALTWRPPRRFDFVRTELTYVPRARRGDLLDRLLTDIAAPDGRLIVCQYSSRAEHPRPPALADVLASLGFGSLVRAQRAAPCGTTPLLELCVLASGSP